jgi:Cof subfamily protein (haloacid dehalogenase superfamily)
MDEHKGPANTAISAVLADVDGTLVTSDKVLTERAVRTVKRLHEQGVLFAITSGRPPRGMRMLVEPLELKGPIAAFNGGMIVMPDKSVVDERTIPDDAAGPVIESIRASGLDAWIYRSTEWYVTDAHAPHVGHEASTVQFQPTVVPTYDGLLDRVVKIVGVSDDLDRVAGCEAALRERFSTHVSAARSQPYYVDVTNPTANKGVVIERLSSFYEIPLDQIAAIGDQPSDVLMFERSGLSIAMGNANAEVQRQATCVTASDDDEGFAKGIEQYVLPRAVAAPTRPGPESVRHDG